MMSRVRWARLSTDVKATSNFRPCAFSLRPAARASATPPSERSMSRQPVNRFFLFHSLSPWRTSTGRWSVIAQSSDDQISEVGKPQHIRHGIEARLLAARPQCRLERAAREEHPLLGFVYELDAL